MALVQTICESKQMREFDPAITNQRPSIQVTHTSFHQMKLDPSLKVQH